MVIFGKSRLKSEHIGTVITCIFKISKCDNFGYEQYFRSGKKHLVAGILSIINNIKLKFGHPQFGDPPTPLSTFKWSVNTLPHIDHRETALVAFKIFCMAAFISFSISCSTSTEKSIWYNTFRYRYLTS